jgi:hypothetical protein
MVGLGFGTSATVSAQEVVDPTSCGHFETWEDAQAALDSGDYPADVLDPDDDGVACESAFGVGDGDIPADQMACTNFDDQRAAQAHYDATSSAAQRDILDPDGDEIACEDAFEEPEAEEPPEEEPVSSLPSTGAGQGNGPSADVLLAASLAIAAILFAASAAYRHGSKSFG